VSLLAGGELEGYRPGDPAAADLVSARGWLGLSFTFP
jgi:hypothetical protein